MADMVSSERGILIEQPQSSEVYQRLPEPEYKGDILYTNKLRKWQSRVEVARKIRDEKLKDLMVLIDFYEGRQWHDDEMPLMQDRTTVNMIFSTIKKELPYLYFQNPAPIVIERRQEFELNAFAMRELLKYYTKYNLGTELKKHVRLCILDAKFSFGTLKTLYTPKIGNNPKVGKPVLAGYDDFNDPIFLTDEQGNIIAEPKEILISQLYAIERISPKEMLIDAECRNFIKKAKWVGQEIVKPLSYFEDNPLYKNTEQLKRNIELTEVFDKTLNKSQQEISAVRNLTSIEDTQMVRFVEIHDWENNRLLCLPDNMDFFIREERLDHCLFSFLKFNESPDNFYPVSDVAIEKPIQEEINIGRSLMITHARRSARKYVYDENTFRGIDEVEGINAMKDPDDMTMVKIADTEKPPVPLQMATQDFGVFQNLIQSRTDYNEISASTESQRGVTERRKTKGEAGFQEQHGAVRRSDKQSLVADFIVDTYENLAKLIQDTLTIPQAIKIIGNAGVFWTEVSRQDIQGEFFFDVEVSEMRPQIPEIDRRELAEFITSLSNFMKAILSDPISQVIFDIQGTISEFAKAYPSINVSKMLRANVTPEQIAQIVMMQLQGGNNQGQGNPGAEQ